MKQRFLRWLAKTLVHHARMVWQDQDEDITILYFGSLPVAMPPVLRKEIQGIWNDMFQSQIDAIDEQLAEYYGTDNWEELISSRIREFEEIEATGGWEPWEPYDTDLARGREVHGGPGIDEDGNYVDVKCNCPKCTDFYDRRDTFDEEDWERVLEDFHDPSWWQDDEDDLEDRIDWLFSESSGSPGP